MYMGSRTGRGWEKRGGEREVKNLKIKILCTVEPPIVLPPRKGHCKLDLYKGHC